MFAALFTWTKYQIEIELCVKFYKLICKIVPLLNKVVHMYNFITNITLKLKTSFNKKNYIIYRYVYFLIYYKIIY